MNSHVHLRTAALVAAAGILVLLSLAPEGMASEDAKVRDRFGHVVGSVTVSPQIGPWSAVVRDRKARKVGTVGVDGLATDVWWFITTNHRYIPLSEAGASRWEVRDPRTDTVTGAAVRASSKWVIRRRVEDGWRVVGSVPRDLAGQYAIGAGRALLFGAFNAWKVRNAKGDVRGTVKVAGDGRSAVYEFPSGKYAGRVRESPDGWEVVSAYGGRSVIYQEHGSEGFLSIGGETRTFFSDGRWVLQVTIEGDETTPTRHKTVGHMTGLCQGQYALAAVYLLTLR